MLKYVFLLVFAVVCFAFRLTDWEPMSQEERAYKDTVEKLLHAGLPLTKALPEAEAYMRKQYGGKINWPYPAEELLYRKKVDWLSSVADFNGSAEAERQALNAVLKTNWRQS